MPAIVTYLAGLATALLAGYLQHRWTLSRGFAKTRRDQRVQAYRDLMGMKITTQQFYVSRFEALIFSDYHEAKWKLAGAPQQSIDLDEALRWMHKSEDYVVDITKNNQRLFETLASVSILFPEVDNLSALVDRLYLFRSPRIEGPPIHGTLKELETWKASAVKQLQELVSREYGNPIETLAQALASALKRTESW